MEISQGAYETHGITSEFLTDKPKFKDIANEFQEFVHEKKLVIHNADFDLAFLNKELKEAGYSKIPNTNIIDTLNVAREKFPGAQNSLDALCKRFKIDNSRRQKHSALLDCELLAKVYIELFEKKEPSFEFQIKDDDTTIKDVEDFKNREQLIQEITSEEKDSHRNFLKKDLPKSSMLN
jgi:DNA polymerase-3 subunit epsilon